jgi:Sulfotransferase family
MIGRHPELVDVPELKLFAYPTLGELEDSLPRFWIERGLTHRSPGLVRAVAEFMFSGQTLTSLAMARVWLSARRQWSGADVFDVLMERTHPRCCIEKSPEHVDSDETLARLAAAYPRARYLHLTRHPVTTQQSMARHMARIAGRTGSDDQPMAGIQAWFTTHARILQFADGLPGSRCLRIRSEDVLNDRGSTLREIASWLGLRADDSAIGAMTNPGASPFARFGPQASGVAGGNDPDFLNDPVPHPVELPRTVDPPSGWSGEEELWSVVRRLGAELGYG